MTSNGVHPSPVKTELAADLEKKKILGQVEYYFGDINLPRDKFLQEEMKQDGGWVPLATMLKCNRLAALSTDEAVIAEALKDSRLIDVSEDGKKIRRSPEVPLPENTLEYWQEIKRRTVYMKGFPQDATLDEIAEFVRQFGEVKNVLMRKTKATTITPKVFKGSVFVTYADEEQAKRVAALKDIKFKEEHELVNQMQEEYWANRKAAILAKMTPPVCQNGVKPASNLQEVVEYGLEELATHLSLGDAFVDWMHTRPYNPDDPVLVLNFLPQFEQLVWPSRQDIYNALQGLADDYRDNSFFFISPDRLFNTKVQMFWHFPGVFNSPAGIPQMYWMNGQIRYHPQQQLISTHVIQSVSSTRFTVWEDYQFFRTV